MSDDCVFCGSTMGLNTMMAITVGDQKIQVRICDEHAQNATIKSIKKAFLAKNADLKKLEKLQQEAEDLGYMLVPREQPSLVVPVPAVISVPVTPRPQPAVVDSRVKPLPRQPSRKLQLPGIPAVSGGVPSVPGMESGEEPPTQAPVLESADAKTIISTPVEAQVLERPPDQFGGKPTIVVPKKIVGNTGTTDIRIINTNDTIKFGARDLVDKQYARQRHVDDCSVCKGQGSVMNGQPCPRCKGAGVMVR